MILTELLETFGLGSGARPRLDPNPALGRVRTNVVALAAMLGLLPLSAADLGNRVIVGYFAEWGVHARNYHVTNVPAAQLTHLYYAFVRPVFDGQTGQARVELVDPFAAIEKSYPGDTGGEPFRGSFNQLKKLKAAHPHLKTVLAVGGVTLSQSFSDIAATASARQSFAESCRNFMVQYGFDGLDIDWEFPVEGGAPDVEHRPADAANLVLLIQELRQVLDQQEIADGRDYLLTMDVSATKESLDARYGIPAMIGGLDWIHIMAYAMAGPWAPFTGHQAPLYGNPRSPYGDYHAAEPIVHLLNQGVPAQKLVLGVPFYGQGFKGVPGDQNGLFQPHAGESLEGTWAPGIFAYHDLRDGTRGHRYINAGGFAEHWDPSGHAPFLYNGGTDVFITYENPRALRLKSRFVKELNLRGMMCWALDFDSADHELLNTIHGSLAASGPPPGKDVCRIDFDQHAAGWSYSYSYAAYGGTNFAERNIPTEDLPTGWSLAPSVGYGGSTALRVDGDFSAVPVPGSLTMDQRRVTYAYAGLGAGGGSQEVVNANLPTAELRDYQFEFAAAVSSGFVPGESTASATWKLEIQAPDNTILPPDADTAADTLIALEGEFAALSAVLTTFEYRLDEAGIVAGSPARLAQYLPAVSQVNINFNFWAVTREFGHDAGNAVLFDNLVARQVGGQEPAQLSIAPEPLSGGLIISWQGAGTLQQASAVDGEFLPLENVDSPFLVAPSGAAAFFRVSSP